MATTAVETLLVKLEARITDFEKKMAQAERRATTASTRITRTFNAVPGVINKAFGLIGVGVSAGALIRLVRDTIKSNEALGDLAEKLGLTAEQLQELNFVADQNGAKQEDLQAGFRGMTKFLADASREGKQSTAVLEQLGLSFDDLKNKSPEDTFITLLDAVGKIQNPLQRNAVLIQVFGRAGTSLAQVAALGAEKINALTQRAREMGLIIGNDAVKAFQDAGDKLGILEKAWDANAAALSVGFLPLLDDLIALLISPGFREGIKNLGEEISRSIQQDIKDLQGLLALAQEIVAFVQSGAGIISRTAADDQPSPGRHGDQMIQQRAAFNQRFSDTFGPAASRGPSVEQILQSARGIKQAGDEGVDTFKRVGAATGSAAREAERAAEKYKDVKDNIQFLTEQVGRTEREMFVFNEVNKSGADISTEAGKAIAEQAGHLFDLQEALKSTVERMDLFRDAAKSGLSTFIGDLREGKSAVEALGDALDRVVDRLLDFAIDKFISGLLGESGQAGGGFLASLTGRASGGSVSRNQALLVGERGPEVFVPRTAGVIGSPRQGGGVTVETHYHNNAGVSVREKQTRTTGGVRLDVMIDDLVAAKAQDPSSKISRALTSRGGTVRR